MTERRERIAKIESDEEILSSWLKGPCYHLIGLKERRD